MALDIILSTSRCWLSVTPTRSNIRNSWPAMASRKPAASIGCSPERAALIDDHWRRQERLPKSRHARTIKKPAQAKVARQMPNQKYCQKPPNSRTVVKTAATYESTPVKVAQDNFTRIAVSFFSEHRKIRSYIEGRVSVVVFMVEP